MFFNLPAKNRHSCFLFKLTIGIILYTTPIVSRADILWVSSAADEGPGTLRTALLESRGHIGPDTIRFALSISDPRYDTQSETWTIFLKTPLPILIDDETRIEADCSAVVPGTPLVVIDGSRLPVGQAGLEIRSTANRITNLGWVHFRSYAVVITGASAQHNEIVGCTFGILANGKPAKATEYSGGIHIADGASGNYIGGREANQGNRFQMLARCAILIQGAHHNHILSNHIGNVESGQSNRSNGWERLSQNTEDRSYYPALCLNDGSRNNEIGDDRERGGNIISGNFGDGICLQGAGTDSNRIIGNWIGMDNTGQNQAGNGQAGIAIRPSSMDESEGPRATQIGGVNPKQGNIISGNSGEGILLQGSCPKTRIAGNIIGLDADARAIRSNHSHGISLRPSPYGPIPIEVEIGPDNRIVADVDDCSDEPIAALDLNACRNVAVTENRIGTTVDGALSTRYNTGILLRNGAIHNTIGPGNRILHNKRNGIWILGAETRFNHITRNILRNNHPNQILLQDGANDAAEPPLLTFIDRQGIHGISLPFAQVEIYAGGNDGCTSFLGSTRADSSGRFILKTQIDTIFVRALTTDLQGNTSSFSQVRVLPVELVDFRVRISDEGQIILAWKTTHESNLFGFYIQRSSDGEFWQDQAFLPAGGDDYRGNDYRYIDPSPSARENWYRLRQIDLQGNESLSQSLEVEPALVSLMQMQAPYPNPFNSEIRLVFDLIESQHLTCTILNLKGETVNVLLDQLLQSGRHQVAWNGLDDQNRPVATGVYLVHFSVGGQGFTQKIVYTK
ncbi:T9SS type A sorting domain-containing protein [candidate division KSB1 bacterium]|nr:T9SS type A sorting domain-containing protein [candidate division KSB1 bacterium]